MAADSRLRPREGSLPTASLGESLRLSTDYFLPSFLGGLFSKNPRRVSLLARFHGERRTVRLVEQLRHRYGGLMWVRVPASRALLVLDREAISQVLERSPSIYAEPRLEGKRMSHFQPEALTLSRGEDWEDRRRFTEAVLNTGQSTHHHAASFLELIRAEVAGALAAADRTLTWETFENLFALISRQILFGRNARSEDHLTRDLKLLREEGNRLFAVRKSRHFEGLNESLRRHLENPAPDSLVAVASRTPATERTHVVHQLTQWMLALNETLAVNTARALALLASHPEIERQLRAEVQQVDLADPKAIAHLPLLEGSLQEAMRLWPTTPLLTREALADDVLAGSRIPAGTRILILNLFNHRDREAFPFADHFAPEIWQKPETRELFHHFGGGPRLCPGLDLALFVGQAVLAGLLADQHYVLEGPLLRRSAENGALPYAFDYFKVRFRAERTEPSFSIHQGDLSGARALGGLVAP